MDSIPCWSVDLELTAHLRTVLYDMSILAHRFGRAKEAIEHAIHESVYAPDVVVDIIYYC